MTPTDANEIAKRLGLPPEAARTLKRHGLLRRLDLGEREIRERLWRAHLAHVSATSTLSGHLKLSRKDR